MTKEIRRVPAEWNHPKDEAGDFIPLHVGNYEKYAALWDEGSRRWDDGFVCNHKTASWEPKGPQHSGSYEEWAGERPEQKDFMPNWPQEVRTHYQFYDRVTDTPMSPVVESVEVLARWLADNNVSIGDRDVGYEEWLALLNGSEPMGVALISGRFADSGKISDSAEAVVAIEGQEFKVVTRKESCGATSVDIFVGAMCVYENGMNGCWQQGHQRPEWVSEKFRRHLDAFREL